MINKKTALIALGIVALVTTTAVASIYVAREMDGKETKTVSTTTKKTASADKVVWNEPRPAAAPAQPACNDGNIAGKALGGVGGGIAGSMIGKGNGKTAATIGGTLGGAYVGGEVIPLQNVTCPR